MQCQAKYTFYIGSSSNLEKRLIQHNSGYTKSTKRYKPWRIIYTESYNSKKEANKREWYLKHPVGYLEKKSIIKQYGVEVGGFA